MVKIKKIQLKSLKGISKLLEKRGVDLTTAKTGDVYIKLEKSGGLMDVVIEKIADDRVSFAFYGKLNGDVMRDPELTFVISEQLKYNAKKGTMDKVVYLIPESFQNDYVGVYDEVYYIKDKQVYFKPQGQKSIIELVKDMNNNILMRVDDF
ncbi:MAG: hypothetical protein PF569_09435 [Candidatus Woesearchaeota archaeon]|nr:hypothetical protein [Candidatus Woesearchaeota archaeon]